MEGLQYQDDGDQDERLGDIDLHRLRGPQHVAHPIRNDGDENDQNSDVDNDESDTSHSLNDRDRRGDSDNDDSDDDHAPAPGGQGQGGGDTGPTSKGAQSTQITMLSHRVVDQVNQGNRREQVERLEAALVMPSVS